MGSKYPHRKRARAPNFTRGEIMLVLSLVEKYQHIIENKKTDGSSLRQKYSTWEKIAEEYNANANTYSRTLESIQMCYRSQIKKTKKEYYSAKMQGGESPSKELDEVYLKVKSLLGTSLDGIQSDSEAQFTEEQSYPFLLPKEERTNSLDEDLEADDLTSSSDPITSCWPRENIKCEKAESISLKNVNTSNPATQDSALKDTPKFGSLLLSLRQSKLELLELRKQIAKVELEEKRKESEHNDKVREMELSILKTKLENEKQNCIKPK